MLEMRHIVKRFGTREVLKEISLNLEGGHIFGLLGTNGAGKSTLLRVAAGLYKTEGGEVRLDGERVGDATAAREAICYLSDEPAFLRGATIRSMGALQRAYFSNHDDALLKSLCERFSLPMDEQISGFSKGTRKRVQIVLALARHPRVLLCDETFDGLDPVMREVFRRVLSETTMDEGLVTVLAGHNLQEMESICDSVGFLHEGKLLTSGDLDAVCGEYSRLQFALEREPEEAFICGLEPVRVQRQGRLLTLTLRGNAAQAVQTVKEQKPQYLEELPLSLEEVFVLEMEARGYAKEALGHEE